MDEMIKRRILPSIDSSKIKSFLLETYIQNTDRLLLSDISLQNIKEDLQIALHYFQTHYNDSTGIRENQVLLEKVSDGSYRAFLLLPDINQQKQHGNGNVKDKQQELQELRRSKETLNNLMDTIYKLSKT
ncbi:uncharacterized protein [Amphiura filiformis]|uniref:uncharacterized protein n=1 Tax=Amphiura filiformis TaxID=82378 RepID=UPI003B21A604